MEGNGQKELSEILTGLRSFTRGEITLEGESVKGKSVRQIRQMGISNISEDRMTYGCAPTMSVTDNIIADRYYSGKYSHGIRLDVKAIRHDVESWSRPLMWYAPAPQVCPVCFPAAISRK